MFGFDDWDSKNLVIPNISHIYIYVLRIIVNSWPYIQLIIR